MPCALGQGDPRGKPGLAELLQSMLGGWAQQSEPHRGHTEPHRSHTGATPSRDGGEFTDLRLALELERPQQVVLQKQLDHVVVHAKTCRRKTTTPQPPKGWSAAVECVPTAAVDGWNGCRFAACERRKLATAQRQDADAALQPERTRRLWRRVQLAPAPHGTASRATVRSRTCIMQRATCAIQRAK